jgi:glucan 1,3-beta-glucosidase
VLEPFIVPQIFEDWRASTGKDDIVDEWTLSAAMGTNLEKAMTEHYDTFITEQDFMEIAAAGLNWVRIPIGYWAIETTGDEAFLPKVSWTYFLKAIEWARKYGIRINLDLHALPGSQNGWVRHLYEWSSFVLSRLTDLDTRFHRTTLDAQGRSTSWRT